MKDCNIVKNALSKFQQNDLIFVSKLYHEVLSEHITEMVFYKMLECLCKNGELAKIAKGVYYIPYISQYGVVPSSDKQIIDTFTQNNTGMVVGYVMYNNLNLTTQVPKKIHVLSSVLEQQSQTVKNVIVTQTHLNLTEPVQNMIRGLEVLQHFHEIEDMNYSAFMDFSVKVASNYEDEVFDTVIEQMHYTKSTISFLQELLKYCDVPNHLEKHSLSLSSYKHPKMEEIKELAERTRGI